MPDLNLKRWLWGVCAGVLLVPCAANAAGLGRLTILSGLGQPLNAEIELVSPQKGETLTARLSPIDLYQQANLPYNPALAGARVSVERRANGQPYVKVVTSSTVSEPFAELLIELNSESGRITRQYTLLLDPPGYGRAAGEVAPPTPAVVDAPARSAAAQSVPAVRDDAASKAAAPSAAVGGGVAEGAPVRGSTPIIKPAPQVAEAQAGAKQYGPIKPGETLGRIARAVRPEGATLEQTLVGLYRQNPEAFIKKNMNLVKSGRILKVPEAAELTALAQRDAVREVRLQSADFESFRNRVADRAGTAPEDGGVASGRIGARIAGREAPEPRDTVRVSRGEPSAQAGAKGGPERLRTLEEEAVAREKALAEANERIVQLEKSIKDMQRLADLKKPAAAAPAQAGSPTPSAASTVSSTSTSTGARPGASATPPTPATASTPAPSTPGATTAPTPSATTPTLSLDTQPLPGPLALAPPQSAPAAAASGPTSVAANSAPLDVHKAPSPIPLEGVSTAVPAKSPVVAAAPAARPDLLTQILREPLYLAAGGIVLLGGVLVAMRRRRGSRAPAFKAETTGPGLRSGGNDLSARLAQAETARTQKKAEPSLATAAAPLVAAPTAAIATQARPTPVPSPSGTDADEAVAARASSEGEDNDLDFQAATPVTEAKVTPKAAEPDAPTVTPAPLAASPRASESASVIERAMGDAPASDTPPGTGGSGITLPATGSSVQEPADFEDKADSSSAPLPSLNLPSEGLESTPRSKQTEAVPDLEFTLPDVNLDGNSKAAPAGAVKDGHWQDVQQKFDLAKAYQEMGDKDGARSILEEVIKEGDTTQQVQARRVLGLIN